MSISFDPNNIYTNRLAYHQKQLQVLSNHLLSNAHNLVPKESAPSPHTNIPNLMRVDNNLIDLRNTIADLTKILNDIEQDCNTLTGREIEKNS